MSGILSGEMPETTTEPVLTPEPAPAPTPVPAPALTPAIPALAPIIGPFLALLKSRKGVMMLTAVTFCTVVYLRDPSKLDKLLAFLGTVLPVWLGAHAWQEGKAGNGSNGGK